MRLSKIMHLSLIFIFGLTFLSKAQKEVTDPKGYFDQHIAPATILTKNNVQLKANLIYNDGYLLYYKTQNLPSVQVMSLADISKIVYADGSQEIILGSTTGNTVPVTPPVMLAANAASAPASTPVEQPVSQSQTQTVTSQEKEPDISFDPEKRIIKEDIWLSFGDLGDMAYIGAEGVYNGFSFAWGVRSDFGKSDSWLAENADIRVSLNMGYGNYLGTSGDYYDFEETTQEILGFGGAFGLDFFLYQSDKFKIWSGTELGYLYYTEYGGDVELGDYSEFIFAYGIHVGSQYRFKPNGLGLMVEAGSSTFHYATFGLALPLKIREK